LFIERRKLSSIIALIASSVDDNDLSGAACAFCEIDVAASIESVCRASEKQLYWE
jgi:hypothetical protein